MFGVRQITQYGGLTPLFGGCRSKYFNFRQIWTAIRDGQVADNTLLAFILLIHGLEMLLLLLLNLLLQLRICIGASSRIALGIKVIGNVNFRNGIVIAALAAPDAVALVAATVVTACSASAVSLGCGRRVVGKEFTRHEPGAATALTVLLLQCSLMIVLLLLIVGVWTCS